MAKTTMKKTTSIISWIVLLLCLVLVIGGVVYFTNGFTSDFTTFYVKVEEDTIMANGGGYTISPAEPMTVDVKYTFDKISKQNTGYSVKIVPNTNSDNDFDFTLGGDAYAFGAETDLTKGFDIVKEETSFTISPKGSIKGILSSVYEGYEVGVDTTQIDFEQDLFKVIVTSYNGKASVSVAFKIIDCDVSDIMLDKTQIYF